MTLDGNNDETNGYNSVIKNGTIANANFVKSVIPPIGSVIAWLKSLTGCPELPDGWVECNGQTLSDTDSPFNGITIPDLNITTKRFLRGSSTSGTTGGSETHRHTITRVSDQSGTDASQSIFSPSVTGYTSTLPSYYEVVWIIRIK